MSKEKLFAMKKDNSRLLKRGLVITIPSAVILFVMTTLNEADFQAALAGYFSILVLTLVFILPFMQDFTSVTNYIKSLAKGDKDAVLPELDNNSAEAKDIVSAINEIMNVWNTESINLKAQTMTDAAVLAVLPYPLLLIDKDLCISGANLIAMDIFGHNTKGKCINKIFNDENLINTIKNATETKVKEKIEVKIHTKKERYFNITIESLPTIAKEGAVVVVAFHDITAIKKNEIMQADFIANASHELKTPLAVISGFIETLQTTAKGDEKATDEFLNIMDIQAKRMNKLITNLLCLSRLESKDTIKDEKIDIKKIIETTMKSLKKKADLKNMQFKTEFLDDFTPIGSNDEIAQVLQNLSDNAIKYGDADTDIIISVKSDESSHIISVKNFGNPIDEKYLPRLSERFYRIDSSAKSKAEGTGLGLSIVKSILNRHGAKMWVTSNAINGTEFNILFPKNSEKEI